MICPIYYCVFAYEGKAAEIYFTPGNRRDIITEISIDTKGLILLIVTISDSGGCFI